MPDAYPYAPVIKDLETVINHLASATVAHLYARQLRNPHPSDRLLVELKYGRVQVACNRAARTTIELLGGVYGEKQGLPHILYTVKGAYPHAAAIRSYTAVAEDAMPRRIKRLNTIASYVASVGTAFDTDGLLYSAEFDTLGQLLQDAIDTAAQLCSLLHLDEALKEAIQLINERLKRPIV